MKNPIAILTGEAGNEFEQCRKHYESIAKILRGMPGHLYVTEEDNTSSFPPLLMFPGANRRYNIAPLTQRKIEKLEILVSERAEKTGKIKVVRFTNRRIEFEYMVKQKEKTLLYRFYLSDLKGNLHIWDTLSVEESSYRTLKDMLSERE